MDPRLLLDTHVLVRWLIDSKRLSREQTRVLEAAVRRTEPIALSSITLLEVALLASEGKLSFKDSLNSFFDDLRSNPIFRIVPLSYDVALEVASVKLLKDPADRTIVATARVHQLRLVTSDKRIIDSNLVTTVG